MATTSVDEYVGSRLKLKRSALGITQGELGDITGITFQQIQKYEKGANRIGAGRLYEFAKALNVPVDYFFEGIENSGALNDVKNKSVTNDYNAYDVPEKEINILLKFFSRISDKSIRGSVIDLARSLSLSEKNRELRSLSE